MQLIIKKEDSSVLYKYPDNYTFDKRKDRIVVLDESGKEVVHISDMKEGLYNIETVQEEEVPVDWHGNKYKLESGVYTLKPEYELENEMVSKLDIPQYIETLEFDSNKVEWKGKSNYHKNMSKDRSDKKSIAINSDFA